MDLKLKKRFRTKLKERHRRPLTAYFLFVIFFMFFLGIVFFIPPNQTIDLKIFKLPIIFIFFMDVYLFIFFLFFFLVNKTVGTLVAIFICFYFLLRLVHLTHPIFFIISFSLLITLILFFHKKK